MGQAGSHIQRIVYEISDEPSTYCAYLPFVIKQEPPRQVHRLACDSKLGDNIEIFINADGDDRVNTNNKDSYVMEEDGSD
jgi:hypothetical protein